MNQQNALIGSIQSMFRAAFRLDPVDSELNVIAALASLTPETISALLSENTKETIIEIGIGEAGDKFSHTFQDKVKQIQISSEKVAQINYSFIEADYDGAKTLTITSGGVLKLAGVNFSNKTIYFNADKSSINVEILELY